MRILKGSALSLLALTMSHGAFADPVRTTTIGAKGTVVDAEGDNTKRNTPAANAVTADQQSQGGSDVDLAAAIRRAIVADAALSTYGHNVKVVVKDHAVTLAGPVRSVTERAAIENHAASVAGVNSVRNDITVSPAH